VQLLHTFHPEQPFGELLSSRQTAIRVSVFLLAGSRSIACRMVD
jgi:hypothetical protein